MVNIWICVFLSIVYTVYAGTLQPTFRGKTNGAPPQVDEIARAYAAGYKAALLSVQARSTIPQAPRQQVYSPRSYVPQAPRFQPNFQRARINSAFNFPPARQITVNGIEKSGIPRPGQNRQAAVQRHMNVGHTMVERSAPQMPAFLGKFLHQQQYKKLLNLQQRSQIPKPKDTVIASPQKRDQIVKLNHAARHRNVYLDSMGGDPYGGSSGVLTRQHFWLNRKHKRSAEGNEHFGDVVHEPERFRRSRAPYLGQNLDKYGIIRAIPNFNAPAISKNLLMQNFAKVPDPNEAPAVYQQPYNPGYGAYAYPQYRPYDNSLYARANIVQSKMNQAAVNRNAYLDPMRGYHYVADPKPAQAVYQQPYNPAYGAYAYPQYPPQYKSNLYARGNIVQAKLNLAARNRNAYIASRRSLNAKLNLAARNRKAYIASRRSYTAKMNRAARNRNAYIASRRTLNAKMNRDARNRNAYMASRRSTDPYAYYRLLQARKQYQYPQLRIGKRQTKSANKGKMKNDARHENEHLDSKKDEGY